MVDVLEPAPTNHQILVNVNVAGLTYLDALIATGKYQVKFPAPFVLGGEFVGRVESVGDKVAGFAKGDLVVGQTIVGALAEKVVASADQLIPLPAEFDLPIAATMLQSYATALYALTRRVSVREGDTVLVLGAGGGVGLACIDVAIASGARVIAVASSERKRSLATAMGATATIDPNLENVKLRVREYSKTGADIVVDPVGGSVAEPALRALGSGGRYLVIGFASGTIPSIPINLVLLNNREMLGVDLGSLTMNDPGLVKAINIEVVSGVQGQKYRPTAPELVGLAQVGPVLRGLVDRGLSGKFAVDIRGERVRPETQQTQLHIPPE